MSEEVPLYKIKSSLLPSLNIDYSLLGYKSPANKDLFTYELDLSRRYEERLSELESLRELQRIKNREINSLARRSAGEEFQKSLQQSHKKVEERSQNAQNSGEKNAKVQELMRLCPGIKDPNEAAFYLESHNFEVENAKNFYTSCTGKSTVARSNMYTIKFITPEKREFSQSFEGNKLMWSMLEYVHKNLEKKKNFRVKIKSANKIISLEEMTKKTFDNYGLPSNTVLQIEYT